MQISKQTVSDICTPSIKVHDQFSTKVPDWSKTRCGVGLGVCKPEGHFWNIFLQQNSTI